MGMFQFYAKQRWFEGIKNLIAFDEKTSEVMTLETVVFQGLLFEKLAEKKVNRRKHWTIAIRKALDLSFQLNLNEWVC